MADLRMPQTQREQLMVVVAVLALLGAAAYWYYAYSPGKTAVAAVEEHADSLEASVQRTKADLARGTVNQLREQTKAYADNLALMRQLVPTSNELSTLLDQISTTARRVGLDVGKIQPLGPEVGTDFDAYRYEFNLTGKYHEIASFLTNVASLPRIVVPVNLIMGANATPAANGDNSTVAAFQLHTYVAHTAPPKGGN
jgi:type IV pilus assembly protein PilO